MSDCINEEEIALQGYNQIVSYSNSLRTGGVIIYYKVEWKVTKIFEKKENSEYWIIACMAIRENMQMIIVGIYRSPSGSESKFCEVFSETLESICEQTNDIIIMGDFNIDWSGNSFYKNKIERALNDNGVEQMVHEYTRVTNTSRTIIDYVITNSLKVTVRNCKHSKISDHEIIEILKKDDEKNIEREDNTLDIFKYDKNKFSRELNNKMYYQENMDVEQNVIRFDKCLEETIRKFTFKKRLKNQNRVSRWFNDELYDIKREKIKKYQIAKFQNTAEAWSNYKILRNLYKVKIENEKCKYITRQISNAKDQKHMWREIKALVIKKNQNMIKSVIFNNVEAKDNIEIANNFNKYFVESIQEIMVSIEDVQYNNRLHMTERRFKFREVTISELKNIVKNMKNKPDYCKISTRIIIDNWHIIGKILLNIVNESLEKGQFPENWKETLITPVEKIAKTRKCEEFRPINTLKTCEKILEKIVKEQLEKYMEDNKLLSKYQSGFRRKFSCETAVNFVINRWKNIVRKRRIMAVFLDFKRAFETIDRKILIRKLYMYGIHGNELRWFESYLENRKQITKVNGVKSDTIINNFGVPQGSILGALLFIIYINDMPNVLERCEIVLYADDTLIYTEGACDEECRDNLTNDIDNVNEWLKMNKLKLNEKKTKIMEINMNSDMEFKINDQVIEKVENIKYLGLIIDKELKFKDHIEYMCKKIGKKICFFKRIRKKVSTITAINIYNTIIKPHFEFGSTIIYTCCNKSQLERLQKLQNKAMRTILKCNRYTSIQYMLDMLKWLNIEQRLKCNTLCFIHKIKYGNAPEYLCEQVNYVGEVQPYQLRNAENFRLKRTDATTMQRSLYYMGLKLFNTITNDMKTEQNYNIFRRKCGNFVKNNVN